MSIRPVINERQNRLLSILPRAELDSLRPHLSLVAMPVGRLIGEPEYDMTSALFPLTCCFSLLAELDDATTLEVAAIGSEGMLGLSALMGDTGTPTRALVKSPGFAYRIRATPLQYAFDRSIPLRRSLLGYVQALMLQLGQSAACYKRHTLMQQFCRYLLTNLDSTPCSSALATTHETIANMLGVRRESITVVAGKLHNLGFIHCSRGQLTVLDRAALRANACECYGVIRAAFERMAPQHHDQRAQQSLDRLSTAEGSSHAPSSGSQTRRRHAACHATTHMG